MKYQQAGRDVGLWGGLQQVHFAEDETAQSLVICAVAHGDAQLWAVQQWSRKGAEVQANDELGEPATGLFLCAGRVGKRPTLRA